MRQLCVHRDMKHLGSLESTVELLSATSQFMPDKQSTWFIPDFRTVIFISINILANVDYRQIRTNRVQTVRIGFIPPGGGWYSPI